MQQVLQLDELLAVVLDLSEEVRHGVVERRVVTERLVHDAFSVLRATAALLPDSAGAGRGEAVRVARQLEPRVLAVLEEDVAGGRRQIQGILEFNVWLHSVQEILYIAKKDVEKTRPEYILMVRSFVLQYEIASNVYICKMCSGM